MATKSDQITALQADIVSLMTSKTRKLTEEGRERMRMYHASYNFHRYGSSGSDAPHIRVAARPHHKSY